MNSALNSPLEGVQAACTPVDEAQRLATLRNLGLLDSAPSQSFDRATRLAAALLQVPIVLVSLVDENRQWFKAKIGLNATETPREVSFCAHAVCNREPLIVPDATRDARFSGNPLVTGAPHIRAYLGIPIYSKEGHAIGTLCAIDTEVHAFTDVDVRHLVDCTKVLEDLVHSHELSLGTNAILRLAMERERRFKCLVSLTSQIIWTNNAEGRMAGESSLVGLRSPARRLMNTKTLAGQALCTRRMHSRRLMNGIAVLPRSAHFSLNTGCGGMTASTGTCSVDAAPVVDDDGSIREWVGVHHDITERRLQEEKILAQEAHFRFLADAVPQMVWTARPDGFADYYNQQWFAYTGMTPEQTARGEWGPIHPDDVQNSKQVWNHSVETGDPYQVEQRFKRITDGVYRWHLCRAVRLQDKVRRNGQMVRCLHGCPRLQGGRSDEPVVTSRT